MDTYSVIVKYSHVNMKEAFTFLQSNSTWIGETKYTCIEEKAARKRESTFRSILSAYQCLSAQSVCNAIVKYIGVLAGSSSHILSPANSTQARDIN